MLLPAEIGSHSEKISTFDVTLSKLVSGNKSTFSGTVRISCDGRQYLTFGQWKLSYVEACESETMRRWKKFGDRRPRLGYVDVRGKREYSELADKALSFGEKHTPHANLLVYVHIGDDVFSLLHVTLPELCENEVLLVKDGYILVPGVLGVFLHAKLLSLFIVLRFMRQPFAMDYLNVVYMYYF